MSPWSSLGVGSVSRKEQGHRHNRRSCTEPPWTEPGVGAGWRGVCGSVSWIRSSTIPTIEILGPVGSTWNPELDERETRTAYECDAIRSHVSQLSEWTRSCTSVRSRPLFRDSTVLPPHHARLFGPRATCGVCIPYPRNSGSSPMPVTAVSGSAITPKAVSRNVRIDGDYQSRPPLAFRHFQVPSAFRRCRGGARATCRVPRTRHRRRTW